MSRKPDLWRFSDDRLPNGLRILTLEDHRCPLVSVQMWYHVGSKDEDPERQGFAHMFEHMMFRGTERIGPQDHFKYLNRYGARVNGYTSFDQTVYWEIVPTSQLELALWLEAERLGHLLINEDYFAAEREVVKEERRMRYLSRPYGRLYETLFAAAFKVHPYRWTPIGNMPHLNAATAAELRVFFDTYYVASNAVLVVVGDVSRESVLMQAERHFGGLPLRPVPPRVRVREPALTEPRREVMRDRAPLPRVVLAYHAPAAGDDDALAVNVLAKVMSGGQSSRLYRTLVQGRKLAANVFAADYPLEQAGLFVLSATLKGGVTTASAEAAMLEEIECLVESGIRSSELDKAKNQAVAEYVLREETVHGRAEMLGYAAMILGDPERVNSDLERTQSLTADDVMAVAKRVLSQGHHISLVIEPDDGPPPGEEVADKSNGSGSAMIEVAVPAEMPKSASPKPVTIVKPVTRTLANGLRIAVFEDHSAASVRVSFNAVIGARDDGASQPGLSYVTASTLRRGTQRYSGDELAEIMDLHAMSLTEQIRHDDTSFCLWALADHLPLAAEILADIVQEPVFSEEEVSGFAERAAAREAVNEKNPATVAARLLASSLFGDHPQARPVRGTSVSLSAMTPLAVREHHGRFYAPQVGTLVFAGDVSARQAFDLAEKHFASWSGNSMRTEHAVPPPAERTRILLQAVPGSGQSEIRIGQVVPLSRQSPYYPGARVLSFVFGEAFASRLGRSLRVDKGLTYGASGYLDVEADVASLLVGTFTRTDRTAEAVRVILEEISRLGNEGITADELAVARDSLMGRFEVGLERAWDYAGRWWDLQVWGLPHSWYETYLQALASMEDVAALERTAAELFSRDHLTIVVVGDADRIEQDLRQIAPVQRVDA